MILKKRKYQPAEQCVEKIRYYVNVNDFDVSQIHKQKKICEEKIILNEEIIKTMNCTMTTLISELQSFKKKLVRKPKGFEGNAHKKKKSI